MKKTTLIILIVCLMLTTTIALDSLSKYENLRLTEKEKQVLENSNIQEVEVKIIAEDLIYKCNNDICWNDISWGFQLQTSSTKEVCTTIKGITTCSLVKKTSTELKEDFEKLLTQRTKGFIKTLSKEQEYIQEKEIYQEITR
jgi:hypothetical protein